MKTEHNNNKRLSVTIITIIKPAAYVILLVLTYTLGYLSHSFSTIALPPPILSPQLPPTPPHISSSVLRLSVVNGTELDPFRVKTLCADPIPPENIRQTIINHIFNGDSPFLNFPPPHAAAILHRSTKVKGWGSNGAVFENLIRKVKPKIIVEVGTFLGASAIHMAELTQRLGLNTQILCIDDFRGWAGFRDQFKNIAMLNGHDFLSAWSDINRGLQILRPGGVIFGHDYFTAADNKGVRRAVDLFAKIHGFKVNIDGQHWVIYTTIH